MVFSSDFAFVFCICKDVSVIIEMQVAVQRIVVYEECIYYYYLLGQTQLDCIIQTKVTI